MIGSGIIQESQNRSFVPDLDLNKTIIAPLMICPPTLTGHSEILDYPLDLMQRKHSSVVGFPFRSMVFTDTDGQAGYAIGIGKSKHFRGKLGQRDHQGTQARKISTVCEITEKEVDRSIPSSLPQESLPLVNQPCFCFEPSAEIVCLNGPLA